MIGVVVSEADEASVRIGERLLAVGDWDGEALPDPGGVRRTEGFELRVVEELHLDTVAVAERFADPEAVVFVSRHAGDTGPLLTAHFTGNFGAAEYGGEPGALARACPGAAKRALAALDRHAPEGYDVSMECTHHGPSSVGAPAMFVELGSGPEEWRDPAGAAAVARAVLALRDASPVGDRSLVVLGGGHYAPRATRLARETDWAVGHVAADWALAERREGSVAAAFEASGAEHAVVEGREGLRERVADLGYCAVSETWVRETAGVPLDRVAELEADLGSVDEGLRFGEVRADDHALVDLPDELLAAAAEVDREATRAAADATHVAYQTTEGGTLVAGRGAVAEAAARDALVDRLAAVLEPAYDDVERRADAVVVTETVFDPEAARERGVEEGPAFGRLAAGDPVEVEGECVDPAAVHAERTRRFAV